MSSPSLDTASAIKGLLARAEGGLVELVARGARGVPRERLQQLMRTPARRAVLDAIFWQLPGALDRRKAKGLNITIRWRMTTPGTPAPDVYDVVISDGRARVVRGGVDGRAGVTITVDSAELVRLATGNSNPMQAYFAGKLAVTGDIMQAARLAALFRIPGAAPRREPH